MKRTYEEVEIDIIVMKVDDVVLTSDGTGGEFSIDPIEI